MPAIEDVLRPAGGAGAGGSSTIYVVDVLELLEQLDRGAACVSVRAATLCLGAGDGKDLLLVYATTTAPIRGGCT